MNPEDALPLSPRDYLILFVLLDGVRHGYGILKDVEDVSGGAVRVDPANLYRTLGRMVRDGWVAEAEPAADEREDERRSRWFRLAPLGDRILRAEARRLDALAAAARARDLVPDGGSAG